MTLLYLLDTDILSEPLKPAPDRRVMKRFEAHEGTLATSATVWHELVFGAARLPDSKRRRAIESYLHDVVAVHLPILPYDDRAGAWHGAERARLSQAGRTPAFADGQVAAVARVNGLTLVTGNVRHYKDFAGLSVANWRRP